MVFGPFEANARAGQLRKHGVLVRLSGQPFQILLLLLARPGDLVTREELREQLWSDGTFVDFEHGLNAAINKVRRALADVADQPRYVETIPGRGYRFIGTLEQPSTAALAVGGFVATRLSRGRGLPSRIWLTGAAVVGLAVALFLGSRFDDPSPG